MSDSNDANRLMLVGELTVKNIDQIRTRLLQAIRRNQAVSIDCTLASEIDLSFMQLVLSARKSANAAGKTVVLSRPAYGMLHERLLQAGLLGLADMPPTADQAFWRNEELSDGEDHPRRG